MADLSIIEFGVYGFVTYSSLLMLIISTIKDVNETKINALIRTLYFLPAVVCCGILITAGTSITLDTVNTITLTNSTAGGTNEQIFYEETNTTDEFVLIEPAWMSVHFIFFMTFIIYIFKQMLMMLGVGKEKPSRID